MKNNRIIMPWTLMLLSATLAWGAGHDSWRDVETFETAALTDRGAATLKLPGMKWRHAETDHLVIHYDSKMFALKVARMGEFFYTFIGEELQVKEDRVKGKSHIFVFDDAKDWQVFIKSLNTGMEWPFSLVYGPEMYLQKADSSSRSGDILGHEMTHLVINRYFAHTPPLWLNEGMAEWYEEFAYSAFKGIKKSKSRGFAQLKNRISLTSLVSMSAYPSSPEAIHAFYQTSKYLVGYLLIEQPREKFLPFAEVVSGGMAPLDAMKQFYGFESLDALEDKFEIFIR